MPGKQYLTFILADTVYAANVFQVREVLPYAPPQPLPRFDPVIEGLIRSREQSIPVVNLRRKFGLADKAADAATRIIVLEVNNREAGVISVFGAVADSVNEVLDLDTIGFEDTPELGKSPAAAFIEGIGRQDEAFVIILDVDKIFSFSELSEMKEIDNRLVAPEYAKYTQELPPIPEEAAQAKDEPQSEPEPQAEATDAEQPPQAESAADEPLQAEEAQGEPEPLAEEPPQAEETPDAEQLSQAESAADEPLQAEVEEAQSEPEERATAKAKAKSKAAAEETAGRYDALNYAPEDFELL